MRFPDYCLVDDDVRILFAYNKEVFLKGDGIRVGTEGRFGEVFECENAIAAEWYGKSVCCSGCTIKRSVTQMYRTGEPVVKPPLP